MILKYRIQSRKHRSIPTAATLSWMILLGSLLWLHPSSLFAGEAVDGHLCSRLSAEDGSSDMNAIIDCLESHIKVSDAVQGAAGAVQSSGIRFSARSARLVKTEKNTRLQVVLAITNISESKVGAIMIGPSPTADDNDGQLFLINRTRLVKGFTSCSYNYGFDGATASWCAEHVAAKNFAPLQPGVPVNAHLNFAPESSGEDDIASKIISVTVSLLVYKGKDYTPESTAKSENYEPVSVTIRGIRVKQPTREL